jgi:hypothetical protein
MRKLLATLVLAVTVVAVAPTSVVAATAIEYGLIFAN